MSFTPSQAAQNTAALAGSNLASLASPLSALQTSITGGNLGPAAYIDAVLSSIGVQLESNNALTVNSTTSATYTDVPGTSITFTAPIAKKYVAHCDFAFFFSAGTSPAANVRLVVNGSNGPDMIVGAAALNTHFPIHLMHSATCVVGSNTIKVQWQTQGGTPTLNINAFDYANYIVSG
jgi:hypothetical protein